jgi:hypothetical protein
MSEEELLLLAGFRPEIAKLFDPNQVEALYVFCFYRMDDVDPRLLNEFGTCIEDVEFPRILRQLGFNDETIDILKHNVPEVSVFWWLQNYVESIKFEMKNRVI